MGYALFTAERKKANKNTATTLAREQTNNGDNLAFRFMTSMYMHLALLSNCTGPYISVVKNPMDICNSVSELTESHSPWQSQTSGRTSRCAGNHRPGLPHLNHPVQHVFTSHRSHQKKPEKEGWKSPRKGLLYLLALGLDGARVHVSSFT